MNNTSCGGKNFRAGFTLIELLVVIAIIGILASIVLASLNSSRKKSRDARRLSDLKQLQNALELYSNESGGSYVSDAVTGLATGEAADVALASFVGNHLPAMPIDPSLAANKYMYKTIPDVNTANDASGYCIGTYIEGQ